MSFGRFPTHDERCPGATHGRARAGSDCRGSGGLNRDSARLDLGGLGYVTSRMPLAHFAAIALGIGRLRQGEAAQEAAGRALETLHARVFSRVDRMALTRHAQYAGVHRDIDVSRVHARYVGAQYKTALFLQRYQRPGPSRRPGCRRCLSRRAGAPGGRGRDAAGLQMTRAQIGQYS